MKRKYLKVALALTAFVGWSIQGQAQKLTYEWGLSAGGSDIDIIRAVAADADGNSYATGAFNGLVDFNPQDPNAHDTLRSVRKSSNDNGGDVFVYKLDAEGKMVWVKRFHNTMGYGWGIDVDKQGNVYVAGHYSNRADFNPSENPADTFFMTPGVRGGNAYNQNVFVAKLNANGDFQWAKSFGNEKGKIGGQQAFDLTLDDENNVIVTGHFTGTANFDNIPGAELTSLHANGSYNAFVMKLRSNGDYVWLKGIIGKGSNRGRGVVADKLGNVYAVGDFSDSVSLNPDRKYYQLGTGVFATYPMINLNDYDAYVVKLDSSGNYVWGHAFGGIKEDHCPTIAIDKVNGFIYPVFQINNDGVDFGIQGGQPLALKGFTDATFLKMDFDGNSIWAKSIGGFYSSTNIAGAVVDTRTNVIYGYGDYSYNTNFNPGSNASDTFYIYRPFGGRDPFVVQLDGATGDFGWAKSFPGGTSNKFPGRIALNPTNGSVYTVGYYMTDIDLNGEAGPGDTAIFRSNGSYDFFINKMSCQDTSSGTLVKDIDCNQPVFSFHGVNYTESGVYTQVLINGSGCDSVVTLDLTFRTMPSPFITVSGFTLGVTGGTYSTYQWLLNGSAISGATSDHYTIQQNGDYAVAVTNNEGCIDTSDIYRVNNYTGIEDVQALAKDIHIYPNPTTDILHIQAPIDVNVSVNSLVGRKIFEASDAKEISLQGLSTGVYLLQVRDKNNTLIKVEKVVKK